VRHFEFVVFVGQDGELSLKVASVLLFTLTERPLRGTILSPATLRICQSWLQWEVREYGLLLKLCVFVLWATIREQAQTPVQHVEAVVDCSRDCRDPNQNLRVSWAWDTIQIAFARRQCGGSRLDVWRRGTGHMSRRPMELEPFQ
jgi:hypothetical protein